MQISDRLRKKLSQYRFEIRHIIVLFAVLIAFQIILALFQKSLLGNFLQGTQNWFQKYYAERIAIVTSSSLELLFQNQQRLRAESDSIDNSMVYSLNIFLKQQLIQRSIEEVTLILLQGPAGVCHQQRAGAVCLFQRHAAPCSDRPAGHRGSSTSGRSRTSSRSRRRSSARSATRRRSMCWCPSSRTENIWARSTCGSRRTFPS